jgi:hypothetical protein
LQTILGMIDKFQEGTSNMISNYSLYLIYHAHFADDLGMIDKFQERNNIQ